MLKVKTREAEEKKSTPVRFELTRAMHNRLAGDPVNHSGKVPVKSSESLSWKNRNSQKTVPLSVCRKLCISQT